MDRATPVAHGVNWNANERARPPTVSGRDWSHAVRFTHKTEDDEIYCPRRSQRRAVALFILSVFFVNSVVKTADLPISVSMIQLQLFQLRFHHELAVAVAGLVQEVVVLMIVFRREKDRCRHDLGDDGFVEIFLSRLFGLFR